MVWDPLSLARTGRRTQPLPAAVFPPPVPPPAMREWTPPPPFGGVRVRCVGCGVCCAHRTMVAGWVGSLSSFGLRGPPMLLPLLLNLCVHASRTCMGPPHCWPMKYRALKTHRVVWRMLLPAHVFVYSLPGRFVGLFLVSGAWCMWVAEAECTAVWYCTCQRPSATTLLHAGRCGVLLSDPLLDPLRRRLLSCSYRVVFAVVSCAHHQHAWGWRFQLFVAAGFLPSLQCCTS